MSDIPPDFFADLDGLRLLSTTENSQTATSVAAKVSRSPTAKKIAGEFLRGPIPLPWLTAAAKLSGKAPLVTALALWFEVGRRNSREITLTAAIMVRFAPDRKSKYRGLQSLEKAGLVHVNRELRRNPVVTILDVPGDTPGEDAR